MSETPLRFLKKVEALPQRYRSGQESYYDEILREFLYSGARYAQVKDVGKKPLTVLVGLNNRLKRRKDKVRTCIRSGKVYLEKLDASEQIHLLPSASEKSSNGSLRNENASYDVMTLLGTAIVKSRCKRCNTLNAKDSRVCKDCGFDLYSTEEEYHNSLTEMQALEKSLNCEK
jgi:hypothetical protein